MTARGLVPLPLRLNATVAALGGRWFVAETRPAGREVWTTPQSAAVARAADRLGEFLDRAPVAVARAVVEHDTAADLVGVARRLAWRPGATRPTRLLCDAARVFGGVLVWEGGRFTATGAAQVRRDGAWANPDGRRVPSEREGERAIRLTYARRRPT